jgi:3-hydroxyacyl-CoA dehydrogenase
MGSGIAYVCARSGYNVKLIDKDDEAVRTGIRKMEEIIKNGLERKKISKNEASEIRKRVKTSSEMDESVRNADLVLEAVYEDLDLKKKIFMKIGDVCPSTTILASNTSSLSIRELASASGRADRFIGIHFFNPPAAMRLVEIILGSGTSETTMETVRTFVDSLDKQWVIAKDSPGFIVNRLLAPMLNEAAYLVEEGIASIGDVDKAMMIGAGMPMGPLMLSDLIGIDILQSIMKNLEEKLGSKYSPCPLLGEKIKLNQLGKKSGIGYYRYG